MFDAALEALSGFADPSMFLMLGAGVLAGLILGIIPGIGGTGAVAILLPFILLMDPHQAMAMLIGAVSVIHTSDSITTTLLGVPGSASATVLLQDAHPMAKEGQAARALTICFLSAIIGGLIGAVGLTLAIPVARPLVLAFASPELFMLTVLGVALTAMLSKGNMVKGVLAGLLGILFGQIGGAPAAADYRFTFGQLALNEGLDLVAVALGIFGLAEITHLIATRGSISKVKGLGGGWKQGALDVARNPGHVLRGSLVGVGAGMLPGVGATAGAWMAYGQAVSTSKRKKKFGKGDPRGVIGPESAGSSMEAGDLIPTLLFGIPGAAPMALLMGALLVFGIETGPSMINNHLDLIYTIVWSFVIATVIGAGLCFALSVPLSKISQIPFPIIGAGLIVVLFVSAYQQPQQFGVLQLMLLLGIVGWLMKATAVPRAPFLIGFVLSEPMERYYFLTDSLFQPAEWLLRPMVLVMIGILVLPVLYVGVRAFRAWLHAGNTDVPAPERVPGEAAAPIVGDGALKDTWVPLAFAAVIFVVFLGALVGSTGFSANGALMPRTVAIAGLLMTALLIVAEARRMRRGRQRIDVHQQIKPNLLSFAWIVAFLALVVLVGTIVAALIFVPVFLAVVMRWRWWKIVLYTVIFLAALLALQHWADMALPVGYFTPPLVR